MEKIGLIIILLLLIIIVILIKIILIQPTEPLVQTIEKVEEVVAQEVKPNKPSSVVGATNVVVLKPAPKPIPKVIPKEELKEAFENEPYHIDDAEMEYSKEENEDLATQEEVEAEATLPTDEQTVVDEVEKAQQKKCLDYFQIEDASRVLSRGIDPTEENKATIAEMRGTLLFESVLAQLNGGLSDKANELLDKLDIQLNNKSMRNEIG